MGHHFCSYRIDRKFLRFWRRGWIEQGFRLYLLSNRCSAVYPWLHYAQNLIKLDYYWSTLTIVSKKAPLIRVLFLLTENHEVYKRLVLIRESYEDNSTRNDPSYLIQIIEYRGNLCQIYCICSLSRIMYSRENITT